MCHVSEIIFYWGRKCVWLLLTFQIIQEHLLSGVLASTQIFVVLCDRFWYHIFRITANSLLCAILLCTHLIHRTAIRSQYHYCLYFGNEHAEAQRVIYPNSHSYWVLQECLQLTTGPCSVIISSSFYLMKILKIFSPTSPKETYNIKTPRDREFKAHTQPIKSSRGLCRPAVWDELAFPLKC